LLGTRDRKKPKALPTIETRLNTLAKFEDLKSKFDNIDDADDILIIQTCCEGKKFDFKRLKPKKKNRNIKSK
jgi:hypothetical protein